MRRFPFLFIAAAALIGLALFAGCGDSDDDGPASAADGATTAETTDPGGSEAGGSGGSSDRSGGATPAAAGGPETGFLGEANDICAGYREQLQSELQPYVNKVASLGKDAELEILGEILVPGLEEEIEDLKALNPPAKYEDRMEVAIGKVEELVARAKNEPNVFATEHRPYAKTGKFLAERNLPACGRP